MRTSCLCGREPLLGLRLAGRDAALTGWRATQAGRRDFLSRRDSSLTRRGTAVARRRTGRPLAAARAHRRGRRRRLGRPASPRTGRRCLRAPSPRRGPGATRWVSRARARRDHPWATANPRRAVAPTGRSRRADRTRGWRQRGDRARLALTELHPDAPGIRGLGTSRPAVERHQGGDGKRGDRCGPDQAGRGTQSGYVEPSCPHDTSVRVRTGRLTIQSLDRQGGGSP
jgi:hypothetical protein